MLQKKESSALSLSTVRMPSAQWAEAPTPAPKDAPARSGRPPISMSNTTFDYIVIGAGTAGAPPAQRPLRGGRRPGPLVEGGGQGGHPPVHHPPGVPVKREEGGGGGKGEIG